MTNSNNYILSILYNNNTKEEFIGFHDLLKIDKDLVLFFNGISDREYILNVLKNSKCDLTISLDYRFISDKDIISILKEKNIKVIRIVGEKYSLTKKDYEYLKFANQILVDSVDDDVHYEQDTISLQNNILKKEYKRGENNYVTYFISRLLAPLEISLLVSNIKRSINTYGNVASYLLSFRMNANEKYANILMELKKYKLPVNVKIQFISNPLEDSEEDYNDLDNIIENDIEIIYNTSNFLLNKYLKEPYTRFNYYHLELEVEGICSLTKYKELLNEINLISNYIEKRNYSPLESLIYVYRYLHNYYISSSIDNINSKKILMNEDFTNLFSLILRKLNIKVFNYSSDSHIRNIALINDYKYNVFKIGIIDPYWDAAYQNNHSDLLNKESYTYFMISPKDTLNFSDPECLTLASLLVLNKNIIECINNNSRSSFEVEINNSYNPLIISIYMLIKMGYEINNEEHYYKTIDNLNKKGYFDTLDVDVLKRAIKEVEQSENLTNDNFSVLKTLHDINSSLLKRKYAFQSESFVKISGDKGITKLLKLGNNNK